MLNFAPEVFCLSGPPSVVAALRYKVVGAQSVCAWHCRSVQEREKGKMKRVAGGSQGNGGSGNQQMIGLKWGCNDCQKKVYRTVFEV